MSFVIESVAGGYRRLGEPHFDATLVIDGEQQRAENYGYGWFMPNAPNAPGEVSGQPVPEPLVTVLNQITELMRG